MYPKILRQLALVSNWYYTSITLNEPNNFIFWNLFCVKKYRRSYGYDSIFVPCLNPENLKLFKSNYKVKMVLLGCLPKPDLLFFLDEKN